MNHLVEKENMLKVEDISKKENSENIIKNFQKNPLYEFTSPEDYFNIALTLTKKNKFDEAINVFKKAILLKPDYVEAYFNIGVILYSTGKYLFAIEVFNKVISLNPNYTSAYNYLAISISKGSFLETKPHLHSSILQLLQKKNIVNPATIAKAVISLIKCDSVIKDILKLKDNPDLDDTLIDIISNLSDNKLLIELMGLTPIIDLDLEKLLTRIRSFILLNIDKIQNKNEIIDFQSALALQCFMNEFLYEESELETQSLKILEQSIELLISEGKKPDPFIILCLGSYKPLYSYKWSQLISLPGQYEKVSKTLINDFFTEKTLSSEIPTLQEVTDKISYDVRQQYEENPYPKWTSIKLNPEPLPFDEIIKRFRLKLINNKIDMSASLNVLIAGCGTGRQSIDIATNYKNSKIIAIDLSLRSLAYAKRKTQELGITNIRYMQADILDLAKLGQQFDIIECGGVLHHMKNPMAGWQVLKDCLKAGGLMRIGLYSDIGRQYVVKTRSEIGQLGLDTKKSQIQAFRNNVIKLQKSHHHDLIKISDFYDLSSFRDLVFHVQEHRFNITQIKECLSQLDLSFCGFMNNDEINRRFKLEYNNNDDEYNLDKWKLFEEENINTFSAMYQFWCQKR